MMSIIFETARLVLRGMEERDVETFARYRSDPKVSRYQTWDTPYTPEQATRFISAMQHATPGLPGEWYQIAITLKDSREMIGDCAFSILAQDSKQAEIGFTLAPEYQGQGFAREAVARLLEYLFDDLKLHRVRANCAPENEASGHLLKRVGMRHEGRFVENLWFKGGWADEDWYAILDREWKEQRKQS